MKTVCIIPLKSNSQRVKGKNFRKFKNLPLYQNIIKKVLKIKSSMKIIGLILCRLKQKALLDIDGVLIDSKKIMYYDKNSKIKKNN